MDVRLQQSPSEELLKQNQPGSNKLIGDDDSLSGNPAVDNSSLNTHRVQHDSTNKHPFLRGMNAHNPTQKDDKEESKTEDKKKPASNVKQTNPQTPAPKTPAAKSSDHKGVQDNTLTNEYH